MLYPQKKFNERLKKITDDFNELAAVIATDFDTSLKLSNTALAKNPDIARMLMDHIAGGYSVHESLIITALAFDTDLKRVRAIYDAHRITTAESVNYAKRFLIHTLIKSGFKIADIAIILNCTRQTVYNWYKLPFCF